MLAERIAPPAIWVLSCAKCGELFGWTASIDRRDTLGCRAGLDVCYACDADMTDADMEMRPRAFRAVRYAPDKAKGKQ
jgi:hypothetical protein